jgi:hypothetical protein
MAISRPTPPRTQQLTSKCCKTATCGAVRSVYGRSGQQVRTMWLRSLVLAPALVSVSLPALARSELSDARKWKVLLPTVRASTDCIAREIAASPTALNYAHQENWLEAVKSTAEECRSFGTRLIAEHNRLYGPGTGKRFVEGPYAADLPRAVKARIGPQIARAAAQPAKRADQEPAPAVAVTEMPTQVAARPASFQSDALHRQADPVPPLEARMAPETERETAQPAKAGEPAVPTVVAAAETSARVPDPQPRVRSDAPEGADLRLSASAPNETAVRETAAVEEQSAASVAASTPELSPSAASLAPHADENRLDRPARWSLAYTFALFAVLGATALYGARRTGRWRTGKPQERPVLLQARRQSAPAASEPTQDKSQVRGA